MTTFIIQLFFYAFLVLCTAEYNYFTYPTFLNWVENIEKYKNINQNKSRPICFWKINWILSMESKLLSPIIKEAFFTNPGNLNNLIDQSYAT